MLKGRTWADPEGQKQIYTELLFGRQQRPKEEAVNERNKLNGGDQIHSLLEMCTLPICNRFICIQIIKLQNKTILQHGILSSAGWGRFNNKVCKLTHTTQHFTLAGSVLSQLLLSGLQLVFLFWMLIALQDANHLQESLFPVVTLKLHKVYSVLLADLYMLAAICLLFLTICSYHLILQKPLNCIQSVVLRKGSISPLPPRGST